MICPTRDPSRPHHADQRGSFHPVALRALRALGTLRALRTLSAGAGVLLAGCGDGAGPATRQPTSVQLDPPSLTIDDLGTGQLTVVVLDQDGQPFTSLPDGHSVEWTSDATDIATVNGSGAVSGHQPGDARITATLRPGDLGASVTVTVRTVAIDIEYIDGDGQSGFAGEPLGQPVVVRALDRHGDGVSGVSIAFVVTTGGGAVSAATVSTGADGLAETVWTLGITGSIQTLEARAVGLAGSPLLFQATASVTDVQLESITPDTLVRGGTAKLTGSGFSTTLMNNQVFIDDVLAPVISATPTELVVAIPATCLPAGRSGVRVVVGGQPSELLQHPVVPGPRLALAVGEQVILRSGDPFCINFESSTTPEMYLVGVQSVSEVASNVTPVRVTGAVATPTLDAFAPLRATPTAPGAAGDELPVLHAAHTGAEQKLRARELDWLAPRMQRSLAQLNATTSRNTTLNMTIPASIVVGDVVNLRVEDVNAASICQSFTNIAAIVRKVGTYGIWVEDTANPAGGYTAADFEQLSAFFDSVVHPVIANHFGAPTDLDSNQRVVIVATKEVNRNAEVGGFASVGDLFPRSECPASNEGEYYYARVPDPTGAFGAVTAREAQLRTTKRLLPHEVTHIIQLGRRMQYPGATAVQSTWELEGQALLAEEIVGHHITGRSTGQNYAQLEAWNVPSSTEVWWYTGFGHLGRYFGFIATSSKANGAPEQCTFLGGARHGNNGPCVDPNVNYYGPAWSFLRWLSDQYGASLPGGEQQLHHALIESPHSGFATIEAVVGTPMHTLLAQWSAALYLDDRVAGMDPRLSMTSWNLFQVMDSRVPAARLQPRLRGFTTFVDNVNVRAGSTAYFRVGGTVRPDATLEVGENSGTLLPPNMQVWIVRMQ